MDVNPYQPPEARLEDAPTTAQTYYVVAMRKFFILYFTTFGIYRFYWFYKNWALQKAVTHDNTWPVMRSIFSIFFVHSLFHRVDTKLKSQSLRYYWSPDFLATTFVLAFIVATIAGQLAKRDIGMPFTILMPLVTLPIIAWAVYGGQKAINRAEGDPDGARNRSLSAGNYAWIAAGLLFWLLFAIGMYQILSVSKGTS
jgi:hypothetical protein